MNKNFIPRNIVLEREKKEVNGEKRAVIMLAITTLLVFPLLNEKKKVVEVKDEVVETAKDISYNHKNIKEELEILNVNLVSFKSNNGNIEIELSDMYELEELEKIEKFKINTILNSGNNNYKVSVRRNK